MKRERLFYLDFIRAMSTLLIVLTHYNAIYLYTSPQKLENVVWTLYIDDVYIGALGVTLFLIISGASLMYVYNEKCELGKFYKKRFWSIYPMFWIAYFIMFLIQFYRNQDIYQIPRWKIIFSFLGMDCYLNVFGIETFAIVGEWFLGFIIIFYCLFPFLRWWLKKSPISLIVSTLVLFFIGIFSNMTYLGETLVGRLPLIVFGMLLVSNDWHKKINSKAVAISFIALIINHFFIPNTLPVLRSNIMGMAVFVILVFVSYYIKWNLLKKICMKICEYSYAIFIIHHVIITMMTRKFDLTSISKLSSYLLFLCCCSVIFFAAFLLKKLHDNIMNFIL